METVAGEYNQTITFYERPLISANHDNDTDSGYYSI